MKDHGELLSKKSLPELIDLIEQLITEVGQLKAEVTQLKAENGQLKVENMRLRTENQQLRDELSHFKGLPPKPKIEPSKLEKPDQKGGGKEKNWSKGSKNAKLVIDEVVTIEVPADQKPAGAVFKGYRTYIVQDVIIKKHVTEYRLEQWLKPDGHYVAAKVPASVSGHFGPGLRQYIVDQHQAGRVPQNRIVQGLNDKGVAISEGQVNNILLETGLALKQEVDELFAAGQKSPVLQADDTGARHKGKNGFTTVLCNIFFTYFKSGNSKSRINFLSILCGGNLEYTITPEALMYIEAFNQKDATMDLMREPMNRHFANPEDWNMFLMKHQFGEKTRRILTEGALIGTLLARGALTLDTIIMSDKAGQFNLFRHVLCWIHIERLIKRLIPLNEQDKVEIEQVLDNFWNFYRSLKAYKTSAPELQAGLKKELQLKFDEVFSFRATEIPLAKALKTIRDCKDQLLLVLDHPDIPLHNNLSEGDIREHVTKRKVCGGTRSDDGRDARDIFTSLYKTCKKLGISFWDFLGDRIHNIRKIPPLADLIKEKIVAARTRRMAAGP